MVSVIAGAWVAPRDAWAVPREMPRLGRRGISVDGEGVEGATMNSCFIGKVVVEEVLIAYGQRSAHGFGVNDEVMALLKAWVCLRRSGP